MTKTQMTKRSLFLSALSLLLCVSMLVGSTFAWFTDSVASGINKIEAGNLDVEVYYGKEAAPATNKVTGAEHIFTDVNNNEDILWEPGAVAYANLNVVNKGSLALKYQMAITFDNANFVVGTGDNLTQVLKVAFLDEAVTGTREEILAAAKPSGVLLKDLKEEGFLPKESNQVYGVVIYWEPSAEDNRWNVQNGKVTSDDEPLHIELGLALVATQKDAELDAFDKDYDAGARYPMMTAQTTSTEFNDYSAKVTVPAGVLEPADKVNGYTLKVSDYAFTNNNTAATLSFDMKLMDGNVEVNAAAEYAVEIKLPHPFVNKNKSNFQVLHNGEPVAFEYDPATQTICFTTTSFSPFEIKYIDYTDPSFELYFEETADQYNITKGMFFVNPVNFFVNNPDVLDKVATIDAEHIAVDFKKDQVQYFVVSERATTVFVSPDATAEYVGENGTFNASNVDFRTGVSGSLYKIFDSDANCIKKDASSTVYLLPGTFTEATTISVVSTCDIIGLGNPEDVNVVKSPVHTTKNKVSNRHLFNCTNNDSTKYIQVTIRNLHLDATEKNSYIGSGLFDKGKQVFADNAAVQSIRRSKVKCYDLVIDKAENDASSIALYVNSTNKVDDNKTYPAYMYAMNVVVNAKSVNSVVDAKSTNSYFYYNGVTYADGVEYVGSSSYKNTKATIMSANDWWN